MTCKEMERFTFSDPAVRARMLEMQLLQVDVTRNTESDKAFLRCFNLFGPQGSCFFFDSAGNEMPAPRVIGYQPVAQFGSVLDTVLRASVPPVEQGGKQ